MPSDELFEQMRRRLRERDSDDLLANARTRGLPVRKAFFGAGAAPGSSSAAPAPPGPAPHGSSASAPRRLDLATHADGGAEDDDISEDLPSPGGSRATAAAVPAAAATAPGAGSAADQLPHLSALLSLTSLSETRGGLRMLAALAPQARSSQQQQGGAALGPSEELRRLRGCEWFFLDAQRQPKGPYSADDLRDLYEAANTEVTDSTFVWCRELLPDWMPIERATPLYRYLHADAPAEVAEEAMPLADIAAERALVARSIQAFRERKCEEREAQQRAEREADAEGGGFLDTPVPGGGGGEAEGEGEPPAKRRRGGKGKGGKGGKPRRARAPAKWFELKQNTSVYVTGLPEDTTAEELAQVFSKAGIVRVDPATRQPKAKAYGRGDGLVTYERPESVQLAVQLLDGLPLRGDAHAGAGLRMHIEPAKFEQKGDAYRPREDLQQYEEDTQRRRKQRDARMGWAESGTDPNPRTVVLRNMFTEEEMNRHPALAAELTQEVGEEAARMGRVERVRVFPQSSDHVITILFSSYVAAQQCIAKMNGRWFAGRQISADMWDHKESFGEAARPGASREPAAASGSESGEEDELGSGDESMGDADQE